MGRLCVTDKRYTTDARRPVGILMLSALMLFQFAVRQSLPAVYRRRQLSYARLLPPWCTTGCMSDGVIHPYQVCICAQSMKRIGSPPSQERGMIVDPFAETRGIDRQKGCFECVSTGVDVG